MTERDPDRELDLDDLREALARRLDVEVSALELRGSGADFHVFVLDDLVIRVPRRLRVFGKLPGEREVLDAIGNVFGSLVPQPGARTPNGREAPAPLFAYRWIAGSPIGSAPPSAALVADLADFLTTLHAITHAPGVRDPEPETVVQRLQTVLRARHTGAAILDAPVPAGVVTPCRIHGDLSARNVLVDASGRLAGVIDWSDSAITDPAIDFGAIAQWAGMSVVDELLARTGRAEDAALRARAQMIGELLETLERGRPA